jgi:hypothetical protein
VAARNQQQAGHGEKSRGGQVKSFDDHADKSIEKSLVACWRAPSGGARPREGGGSREMAPDVYPAIYLDSAQYNLEERVGGCGSGFLLSLGSLTLIAAPNVSPNDF